MSMAPTEAPSGRSSHRAWASVRALGRELRDDLLSPRLIGALGMGGAVFLVNLVASVANISMIFVGPLAPYRPAGAGMAAAGALAMAVAASLSSGIRTMVLKPQELPGVLLASVAASMAGGVGARAAASAGGGRELFVTVTAAMMLTTLATGILFLVGARLRLANLVRIAPYPIVGGLVAGAGWLLLRASITVMSGPAPGTASPTGYFEPRTAMLWAPGVVWALATYAMVTRRPHCLVMPGACLLMIGLFHLVAASAGVDMAEARRLGFLMAPFPSGAVWPALHFADIALVRWDLLGRHAVELAAVPLLTMVNMLFATGGLADMAQRDVDLNHEMASSGAANLLAAGTGCQAGHVAIGLTYLGIRTRTETRLTGLVSALLLGVALVFGGSALNGVPNALYGGSLMLTGMLNAGDWLVAGRRRMPTADYLLMVAVCAVVCFIGLMQGVLVGLVVAVILFVGRISRVPLLRSSGTCATVCSRRERPAPRRRLLRTHGEQVRVYRLAGYVFFGSGAQLMDAVAADAPPMRDGRPCWIVLDFTDVTGFDITAVSGFGKLVRKLRPRVERFVIASAPDRFEALMQGQLGSDAEPVTFAASADEALAMAEEALLAWIDGVMSSGAPHGRAARAELLASAGGELLRELEEREATEALIEALEGRTRRVRFAAGRTLVAAGEAAPGLCLVARGAVGEREPAAAGGAVRLRTLGQGDAFAPEAALGPWVSPLDYAAASDAEVDVLDAGALLRLEQENPQLAIEVHRLVAGLLMRAR
ncbi:MAG: SulP family inorganic anion transporter [Armatimonadetes bacterium]|nr:SulP family inorganic anion transporter [Armatimonadota bacterium]